MHSHRRTASPPALALTLVAVTLALAPCLAPSREAHATTVAHVTIEQLARASHLVAVVTVTAQRTRLRRGEIVTDVLVRVEAPVRGAAPSGELTVVLPGGAHEGHIDTVDGTPAVRTGASYLAFLRRLPDDGSSAFFLTHLTAGLAPLARAPSGEVTVAPAPGVRARCDAPTLCPRAPAEALTTRDTALRFPFVSLPELAHALAPEQLR